MRTHHTARRGLLVPTLGLAVTLAVAACSSSSSSSTTSPASSASAATSPTASAAAASTGASATAAASTAPTAAAGSASSPAAAGTPVALITKNWITFFNGKTSSATRIALLQNGQQYAAQVKAQASSATGRTAGASVQKVTLTSPTQATVDYSVLVSGTPVLAGQKGSAVLQDGTWKVSVASFCGLLILQAGGKAVPGCSSAG